MKCKFTINLDMPDYTTDDEELNKVLEMIDEMIEDVFDNLDCNNCEIDYSIENKERNNGGLEITTNGTWTTKTTTRINNSCGKCCFNCGNDHECENSCYFDENKDCGDCDHYEI